MPWPAARLRGAWLNLRAMAAKELRKVRPATVTGKRVAGQGLVVAFIGSDGSGKSTLTAEIRKWLRYKLDVHGYYMGSGQGSTRLLDRLRHAVKGKAKKPKKPKSEGAPRRRKQPGFLDRLVALHQLPAIGSKRRALAAGPPPGRRAAAWWCSTASRRPRSTASMMAPACRTAIPSPGRRAPR